jgi:hypothetical protein
MEHIYGTLLAIYNKYEDKPIRDRILQCLGQSSSQLRFFLLSRLNGNQDSSSALSLRS